MQTIYLNTKQYGRTETIDQFTQSLDAPKNIREFYKYVNSMVIEYRLNGQHVYKSQRCCKDWK